MKTITTSLELINAIDKSIQEGMKSSLQKKALSEKEKQAAMGAKPPPPPAPNQNAQTPTPPPAEKKPSSSTSKTGDVESEKLKNADITPDDIVDKMNAIRSGRSFKDESVSSAMEEYINSMAPAEKVALLAFLKGIAQIVTGEVPAEQVDDPSDSPADVHMHKGKDSKSQSKHIQPNVIKASPPKAPPKKGIENTSAPAPITPKR